MFKNCKLRVFVFTAVLLGAQSVWSQSMLVTYDFFNDFDYDDDGVESYTDTASGLRLTLQTGDGFDWEWQDINNAPKLYIESGGLMIMRGTHGYEMTLTFNKDVQILSYTNNSITGPVSHTDNSDNTLRFTYNSVDYDIKNHASGDTSQENAILAELKAITIAANTPIQLTHLNPDGSGHIYWKELKVKVIPEHSSYGLFTGMIVSGILILSLAIHQRIVAAA